MAYIGNIPKTGNQRKIDFPLDRFGGGSGFNGSSTDFYLRVSGDPVYPGAFQVMAVLNGTVLEPATDYNINNDLIEFTTAPATGATFFAVIFGDRLDIGTVSDGSIIAAKILDGNITTPKLANLSVTADKLANNSINSSKILDDAVTESKILDGAITPDKLNLGAASLPTAQRVGQFAADGNGDYYLTKLVNSVVTWVPLLNKETVLSYVNYGVAVKTGAFTIDGTTNTYNSNYMLDSTGGAFQVTMTATPSVGDFIRFVDVTNQWSINNITVDSSATGANFLDYLNTTDPQLALDSNGWEVLLVYNGSNWKIVT